MKDKHGREIKIDEKGGTRTGKNPRTGHFEIKSVPRNNKFTGKKLTDKEIKENLEND